MGIYEDVSGSQVLLSLRLSFLIWRIESEIEATQELVKRCSI